MELPNLQQWMYCRSGAAIRFAGFYQWARRISPKIQGMLRKLLLASLAIVALQANVLAIGEERAGDPVVTEIIALKQPAFDATKRGDEEYRKKYTELRREYITKRNELILKLYKTDPEHPKTAEYLEQRWRTVDASKAKNPEEYLALIRKDIDDVLGKTSPVALREVGDAVTSEIELQRSLEDGKDPLLVAEDFEKKYPGSKRAARLYTSLSYGATGDLKRKVLTKIISLDPQSKSAGYARGGLRQLDSIGKPFELAFTDAVNGSSVNLASLKGKVVLIDFWATWCGPCIAKLPELTAIYDELHPKGLEVIGVSLDYPEAKGGLTALKAFVAERKLGWPQYYQGNYWDSEFSTSWGINSIPAVFLLDKKGNLREINPAKLKEAVQKLLSE